jgi:hypothetical protein
MSAVNNNPLSLPPSNDQQLPMPLGANQQLALSKLANPLPPAVSQNPTSEHSQFHHLSQTPYFITISSMSCLFNRTNKASKCSSSFTRNKSH